MKLNEVMEEYSSLILDRTFLEFKKNNILTALLESISAMKGNLRFRGIANHSNKIFNTKSKN